MSPDIIFSIEYNAFYKPGSPPKYGYNRNGESINLVDRSDFVRCRDGNRNLFDYLTRKNATDKYDLETVRMIEELTEHTQLTHKDILDYASHRPGSSGAFNAEGDIGKEESAAITRELRKTKSIVWTGILSFEETFGKKFCPNKQAAAALLTETLKNLFRKSHLKYENINWFAAMHTNTDNPHIHIVFWEREPVFTKRGGQELQYATRGKFAQDAIDDFKFSVASYFDDYAIDFSSLRDNLRNSLKISLQDNTEFIQELKEIRELIHSGNTYQYGKLPSELQRRIKLFTSFLIDSSAELKGKKETYIKELMKTQQHYLDLCQRNGITPTAAILNFVNSRTEELYIRLGNDICRTIKELDRQMKDTPNRRQPNEHRKKDSELLDADKELLKKLFSSTNIGSTIEALFTGTWRKDTKEGVQHYRTHQAALLAFCSIVTCFTKDEEQISRLIDASSLYTPELEEQYNGQIDWAAKIDTINTNDKTYKQVAYGLALEHFKAKIRLPSYDNSQNRAALTVNDRQIISKILKTKDAADKYQVIMTSKWDNSRSDTTNSLKSLHIETLGLLSLFARFTDNPQQIERLFKASPLYRPSIWDAKYKNQFAWIDKIEALETYKDTILPYIINHRKQSSSSMQTGTHKVTAKNSAFNSKRMIRAAAFDHRKFYSLLASSIISITTNFDRTFSHCQMALHEQERRRRKKEEALEQSS